jgi:autotransporter-associated beta strand protein
VAVSKIGAGNAVFAGQNTLSGPLTIEAGTLSLVSGSSLVTGLVYRLDASEPETLTFLADGSNVTAWADAEGSGFVFATTNDLNCRSMTPRSSAVVADSTSVAAAHADACSVRA